MFYAQLILGKKGTLGKVWLAVHSEKKLNRNIIFSTDLTKSAGTCVLVSPVVSARASNPPLSRGLDQILPSSVFISRLLCLPNCG